MSKLLILTTNRTYVCQSQLFLLALLSALRPVETSSCLAPDDVPATEHSASPSCGVEQFAARHSYCINIVYFQKPA